MRTLRLLITLAFAIVAVGVPITAQDDDDPLKPLYVYWQINEFATDDSAFAPGEAEMSPTFPRAVFRRILAETEYIPVFMGASDAPGYTPPLFVPELSYNTLFSFDAPTISAQLDTFPEGDFIRLTPYAAFELPPLPLGTQGWSVSLGISPDDDAAIELGIQLAIGMALYTAYDCEAALPLFDNALDKVYAADESEINGLLLISGLQFYRGNCLYAVGEVAEAIQAYEAGLNDPDVNLDASEIFDPVEYTVHTRTNLAFVYMEQGEMEQALATLEPTRDLIIRPLYGFDDIIGYIVAAEIYRAAGEINLADNEISRLLRAMADSESSSIDRLRAQVYTEIGRFRLSYEPPILDEALLDFAFALEADPEYAPAHYWTGVLHMDHGATEAAIESLTTFLANSDDFFDYYQQNLAAEIEDARTRLQELGG